MSNTLKHRGYTWPPNSIKRTVPLVQKSNSFWHCGWAVYRKDAADIGEDWQELFAAASSLQAVGAREKAAMAASEHALTAAMAASAKRARETAATAASAKRARGTAATVASAK